jgi:hypothetical protein
MEGDFATMTSAAIEAITPPPANALQGGSLIPICARGVELEAAAYRVWDQSDDFMPRGTLEIDRLEREGDHLYSQAKALGGVAADMPASDMAEVIAKAKLLVALSPRDDDCERGRLAVSLARDLIALRG